MGGVGVFSIRSIRIRDDFALCLTRRTIRYTCRSSQNKQALPLLFGVGQGTSLLEQGQQTHATVSHTGDTAVRGLVRNQHGLTKHHQGRKSPETSEALPKGTAAIRHGAAPEGHQVIDYIFSQRSRPPSQLPTRHKLVSSTSWTPQAGHATNGQATSRTTRTRHKPGRGSGEQSPRGEGGIMRATFGILSLLGSRYDFQGWLDLEERE